MKISTVHRWGWFTLFYMVAVILWGAFVRATGSGAGCGDHWPLCNGVVVPREPQIETLIELTHRLTSGLALLFVFALYFLARKATPKRHPVRHAAAWTVGFIIVEALIGAALVLFELVAHNASLKRMLSMSLHLVNTFALLTALSLCIWRVSDESRLESSPMRELLRHPLSAGVGFLLILSGMTGAIAALGDTLYNGVGALPLQAYFDGRTPLLLRLRLIHPIIACLSAVLVLYHQAKHWKLYDSPYFSALGWSVSITTLVQIGLGFVNVQLMAPVWMQLVHLGVGVSLWVLYSFFVFVVISKNQLSHGK
jgi:cytochrome c oxidase assembly protein subunit 15